MLSASQLAAIIHSSNLFDERFYCGQLTARFGTFQMDPVLHYIIEGEASGLWPNPLFHPAFYAEELNRTSRHINLLADYIDGGWRDVARTHPLFDNTFYATNNPDVVAANLPPLDHFLSSGGLEGRNPHPLFHSSTYRHATPGLLESNENPLVHYLRTGGRDTKQTHPAFDGDFYLATNPEVAASGASPLLHFITVGLAEGRRPDWRFSPAAFALGQTDCRRLLDDRAILAAREVVLSSEQDYDYLSATINRRRDSAPAADAGADASEPVRLVAFYLPQFHPIPENDSAWGEGFTEWTNVRRARPNFVGHDQPRVPTTLGYYDLRDGDVLSAQAELAKNYGLYGFCYYWYWFNGRKPLAIPLENMLASGRPDFPFCLCWANEGWTRKWAGGDELILGQVYSEADDLAHAEDLARYMRDPRYIRVGDKPLLLIYRADALPVLPDYLNRWRAMFAAIGIPAIHVAMVESASFAWKSHDPRLLGFDSAVEFPPHGGTGVLPPPPDMRSSSFRGAVYDFRDTVLRYATAPLPAYPRSRTVMAGWDNTARYQDNAAIFMNATPGGYRAWLESAMRDVKATRCPGERIVFINAWNEWSEGTYLEPDATWGHRYLEATREAVSSEIK